MSRRDDITAMISRGEAAITELQPLMEQLTVAETKLQSEHQRAHAELRESFTHLRAELAAREAALEAQLAAVLAPSTTALANQRTAYDDLAYTMSVRLGNIRRAVETEADGIILAKGKRWQNLMEQVRSGAGHFFWRMSLDRSGRIS